VVPTEAALLDDDEGGALAVLKDADSADEDASAAAVPAAISALASDELVLPELEMPAAKPTPLLSPSVTVASGTFSTEGYFTRRSREDTQGGEAGLLPLKVKKETVGEEVLDQEGMRRRLLGDAGAGMGAAQLHEELGGQLVDVSIFCQGVGLTDRCHDSSRRTLSTSRTSSRRRRRSSSQHRARSRVSIDGLLCNDLSIYLHADSLQKTWTEQWLQRASSRLSRQRVVAPLA
jgi:hypothetical protein